MHDPVGGLGYIATTVIGAQIRVLRNWAWRLFGFCESRTAMVAPDGDVMVETAHLWVGFRGSVDRGGDVTEFFFAATERPSLGDEGCVALLLRCLK